MKFLSQMKQKTLLTMLPVVFLAGFGAFAWLANHTLDRAKIGSEAYKEIEVQNAFYADLAPPALFLVEPYSVVLRMADADSPEQRARLLVMYQDLMKIHHQEDARWDEQLKGSEVKKIFDADTTDEEFGDIVDKEFLPAFERGDKAAMKQIVMQKVTPIYDKHDAGITKVIEDVEKAIAHEEKAVQDMVAQQAKIEMLVGIVLLAFVVALSLFVRSMAIKQQKAQEDLTVETERMRQREQEDAKKLQNGVETILTVVSAASTGDLTHDVRVDQEGAIGHMASGLDTFLSDLRQSITAISSNAQTLSSASDELSAVSQEMSANAVETSTQANTVSAASEQLSVNVQTVAAGTEEMTTSIREIARSAAEAAKVASAAVAIAATANTTVEKLAASSSEVGKVIKLITSVAQQTKTLALNATVEAARAGEAGKGFAVVANEVKELAKETAKATEDISQKIEAIQADTRSAVEAIGQITSTINQINDIQNTIASAVEEQTATTNEMSRNLSEGAKGTNEIARNITGVAKAAQDTSAGAAKSLEAAQALSKMAQDLERLVGKYRAAA